MVLNFLMVTAFLLLNISIIKTFLVDVEPLWSSLNHPIVSSLIIDH
jgi:hypothetical protein